MIGEMVDYLAILANMEEAGEDIYEAAVNIGIKNEYELTIQRWLQGDLALKVEKKYGEGILKKFAAAIHVNHSTLKQRRAMSDFYEKDTRVSFENMGYSHYREAMRLGVLEEAVQALQHASDEDMPVWIFKDYIDLKLGKEKSESTNIPGKIERVFDRDGMCIIEISIGLDDREAIQDIEMVTIKTKSL